MFVSDTFVRACDRLGISVQPARKDTPTDKGVVEATFAAIKTLFAQHVAGLHRREPDHARPRTSKAAWTIARVAGSARRVGDRRAGSTGRTTGCATRIAPRRELSPNEKYAALVAAAGYLPLTLDRRGLHRAAAGDMAADQRLRRPDRQPHLRLRRAGPLPAPALRGRRRKRGLWEVHYDPYDLSQVLVRNHHDGGWITVAWTHLPMVAAPFADFTWRHARQPGRRVRPRGHRDRDRPRAWTTCSPAPSTARTRAGRKIAARTRAAAAAAPPAPTPRARRAESRRRRAADAAGRTRRR